MQYVRAHRGELVFNDYGSDWRAVAPNLEVIVAKGRDYRGKMRFTGGTIVIQKYEPMSAGLTAGFKVVDNKIVLDRIDLITDGAVFASNADKNPTLTIMALAWRTADHILDRMKRREL